MWHEDGANDKTKSAPLVEMLHIREKCDPRAHMIRGWDEGDTWGFLQRLVLWRSIASFSVSCWFRTSSLFITITSYIGDKVFPNFQKCQIIFIFPFFPPSLSFFLLSHACSTNFENKTKPQVHPQQGHLTDSVGSSAPYNLGRSLWRPPPPPYWLTQSLAPWTWLLP